VREQVKGLLLKFPFIRFFEFCARATRTKVLAPLLVLTAFSVRYAVLYLFIYTAAQCDFGRPKCLVYDFAFASGEFGADVFDDESAVMLAVLQGFEVS
jgi:hypothetical protein